MGLWAWIICHQKLQVPRQWICSIWKHRIKKCRVSWFIVTWFIFTVWISKVAVFLCKVYPFLWMLIFQGQTSLVDLLVAKGAVVNATDYHGSTPLHLACQKGYQSVTVSTTPNLNNKYMTLAKLFCCYCHLDLLGSFYQNWVSCQNGGSFIIVVCKILYVFFCKAFSHW